MIGSVLFYVLYPLWRYFFGRSSAIAKPGISGSCVDGKQVCTGADVPPSSSSTDNQLAERQEHAEKGSQSATVGEQQTNTELHGNTMDTMADLPSTGTSEDMLMDHWDPLVQDNQATTYLRQQVFDVNLNEIEPAESTGSVQQHQGVLPDDNWSLGPSGLLASDLQAPPPSRESWDEYTEHWDEYTEHWDEYTEHTQVLDLRSLLLDGSQTQQVDERPEEAEGSRCPQSGWHFSTGPGLREVVHRPLWQSPSMSYYPPFQHTDPLEVVRRVWKEVNKSQIPGSSDHQSASFHFTVMSYNILAQDLLEANQQLYSHCPQEVLYWSHRCHLLIQEILQWMPDIMCLQEVQESHYKDQLQPFLSQTGYECVYKRRTGTKTDGCAICYRSVRFSVISTSLLEFLRPDTELLDRDNVGVALLLQPIPSSGATATAPPICIANTHLLFNPRRGDVKLAQLAIVLAEIHAMVKACESRGQQCSVILCGDFNAVPHMPLYQLITTGQLYYHSLPAWMVSGQEDLSHKDYLHRLWAPLWPSSLGVTDGCQYTTGQEKCERHTNKGGKLQYSHDFLRELRLCPAACVRPADLEYIPNVTDNTPDISGKNFPQVPSMGPTICHGLRLRSVYEHFLPGSGLPEVTTLHSEAGATVDYIFYTPKCDPPSDDRKGDGSHLSGGLDLIGYLSLLSEESLWSMRGLPNQHFPSDHLSLLAKFQLDLSPAL